MERLSEERLQLVKDVRGGKYSYEWVLEYSEKMESVLESLYKNSDLQHKPRIVELNNILVELSND